MQNRKQSNPGSSTDLFWSGALVSVLCVFTNVISFDSPFEICRNLRSASRLFRLFLPAHPTLLMLLWNIAGKLKKMRQNLEAL